MDQRWTQQCFTMLASQISISQQVDRYYLADAGFPICDALIIPKQGVHYHLAEWGRAQQRGAYLNLMFFYYLKFDYRPANADELFNLRHASAHNVIE